MTAAHMRLKVFRSDEPQAIVPRARSLGQHAARNREILRERENGTSLEELADKYGLQRATVKALLIRERHRRAFESLRQPAEAV